MRLGVSNDASRVWLCLSRSSIVVVGASLNPFTRSMCMRREGRRDPTEEPKGGRKADFGDETEDGCNRPHSSSLTRQSLLLNCVRCVLLTGTDTSLGAALLASHLDVVPVDAPERWEHPPFNATIHDGFIYARGTLDDKVSPEDFV